MTTREQLSRYWPLLGLELTTPRLSLRPLADEDLGPLLDLESHGVHLPEEMPFEIPWTTGEPVQRAQNSLRHWWQSRASMTPDQWEVEFGVWVDDRVAGVQGLRARHFAVLRHIDTGSWLGRQFQGQGIGTEMRSAVLQFAFDVLDAQSASSGAFADNPKSLGVSAKLGYQLNGIGWKHRRPGERAQHQDLLVTPETFIRPEWTVEVRGFDDCKGQLGL